MAAAPPGHEPGAHGVSGAASSGLVAVAYSGGRDSLALLHTTCRAAAALGLQVLAIHVHHGLMPEADAWLRQAEQRVGRWRRRGWPVRLVAERLSGQPAPGDSVEAWARAGRHAALARLAQAEGASLLLLAQHRQDQAETVLLQLLRGAGPAGLAAMPMQIERDGIVWARPWLQQPRRAIEAYVQRHRLKPIDDPSNDDTRWARNRLRHRVWPPLQLAFADAEKALAAVARRAAEADAALAELAALDAAACTDASGALAVAAWRQLSPARQANLLRAWWHRHTGRGAPETLVQRLLLELPAASGQGPSARPAARQARWPPVAGWQAAHYRGLLTVQPERPLVASKRALDHPSIKPPSSLSSRLVQAAPPAVGPGEAAAPLDLSQPGWHPVPTWGGGFLVTACQAQGIAPAMLQGIALRAREGGEQFQRAANSLPRSLKKQFQAAGLAPDRRGGPLVWRGDQLVFVPGLGVDARAWAAPGQPQCRLGWHPGEGPPPGEPAGPR